MKETSSTTVSTVRASNLEMDASTKDSSLTTYTTEKGD
jgi:hypothetical protein